MDFAIYLASGAGGPVHKTLTRARTEAPTDYSHQQGWGLLALQNAFFHLTHAESLESGLVDTAARGGDADTNGAIAGALLGAVHGRDALPSRWRRLVTKCRPMRSRAHVRNPRPRMFWPLDALLLVERLLLAGRTR